MCILLSVHFVINESQIIPNPGNFPKPCESMPSLGFGEWASLLLALLFSQICFVQKEISLERLRVLWYSLNSNLVVVALLWKLSVRLVTSWFLTIGWWYPREVSFEREQQALKQIPDFQVKSEPLLPSLCPAGHFRLTSFAEDLPFSWGFPMSCLAPASPCPSNWLSSLCLDTCAQQM